MANAIEALLADHQMIRKLLQAFQLENPRFPEVFVTLQRIVKAHAWFEDQIFLPALRAEPLLERLNREISQEHQDIEFLFEKAKHAAQNPARKKEAYVLQLRTVLDTHFRKEEDALFPIAERILNSEGLNRLGLEMRRRRTEVRPVE